MEIRGLNFRDVREPDLRNSWNGFTKCVIEFLNGDRHGGEIRNLSAFSGGGFAPERGRVLEFRRAPINVVVISDVYFVVLART